MRSMSFVNVGIIGPGCPARLAAARLRRAFVRPILAAPPVRATQPSILLQISVKAFSHGMSTGLFTGKEPHTKQKNNFPLELRAKTPRHHDSILTASIPPNKPLPLSHTHTLQPSNTHPLYCLSRAHAATSDIIYTSLSYPNQSPIKYTPPLPLSSLFTHYPHIPCFTLLPLILIPHTLPLPAAATSDNILAPHSSPFAMQYDIRNTTYEIQIKLPYLPQTNKMLI